jgi:ADP-ribose pyrophosphatase YjhB (NUDIX family)
MSQELVDIVDDRDVPTGETTPLDKSLHTSPIPHRVSAVLVFRPNGKLIVQVHKHHGRRFDHSVGGHVSAGEDYLTAAKREMSEELELDVPLEELATGVKSHEYYHQTGDRMLHIFGVYVATVPEGWRLEETEEVDQVVDMEVNEIVELMNTDPDRFLQGFFTSMGVYLKHTGSDKTITAYDKNWGEL